MKLHISKCEKYNIVYVYNNRKVMKKEARKFGFTIQDTIEFNQRQVASILEAMQKLSALTGNTIDYKLGK